MQTFSQRILIVALLTTGWLLSSGCGGTASHDQAATDTPSSHPSYGQDTEKLPSMSRKDQFDVYGDQRAACDQLYNKTLWSESLGCCQALWTSHGADMSVRGKVDLLQLMSRIYCITENFTEAKSCYTEILEHDQYWLPEEFDAYPTSWREPIIEAYRDRDYFAGRGHGFQTLALLDFVVGDMTPDELNLSAAEKAFADYITAYLQEALREAPGQGAARLQVVSYRERTQLMAELATEYGSGSAQAFTADLVDQSTLAQAGRVKAVQAFLQGSITRLHDDINIAFYITRVETGDQTCGVTRAGKVDDWASIMRDALSECLECATGQAVLPSGGAGPEQLGPMNRAVAALTEFHDALALQEQGDYQGAMAHAKAAAQMRPGVPEFAVLVSDLGYAQESVAMSEAVALPSPQLGSF